MTTTYTFDVFSSLDGFGAADGDWSGYWGKQGPELLDHRLALYEPEQRMVLGANTYRALAQMLAAGTEESDVPLRSHGSLSMNRALMAAGLVDLVQVTLFPVVTGRSGLDPIFQGAADFDLELIESRTLDGRTLELSYRPTLHR
ncbi:dihydrofolate reductase family protein [Promicromonospora aerolata]|uniref:Dihydrofolate reductase family protein n=1 Tax=Promicromonospora aerolata TaxID=195749 RepID=A0ABW4VFP1_9MICO